MNGLKYDPQTLRRCGCSSRTVFRASRTTQSGECSLHTTSVRDSRNLKCKKLDHLQKERRDILDINKLIQHFCVWLPSWSWRDLLQLCCSTPWQGFWHTTSLRFGTWKHASFYVPTGGSTTKLRLLILLLLPWMPRKHVKLRCSHRILHDLRRFIHCRCQQSQNVFSNPSTANLILCVYIYILLLLGGGLSWPKWHLFDITNTTNSSDFLNFTWMDQLMGYASHLPVDLWNL